MSSHRIVTGPEDLEGGWFVIDDEVEHLEDVGWQPPRRGQRAVPDAERTVIRAGAHTFTVGDTVELAEGAVLDTGFRDAVRRYWRTSIIVVVSPLTFWVLHLVQLGWLDDGGEVRRRILLAVATVPVVLLVVGLWSVLTRSPHGTVTRAMAGWRMRGDYDRQRRDSVS
ncbi:hypothetical protein [Curtobacterium sp. MCPF17_052]|uniref:hypothetical protein n=1 Tax=Curtobacterium sp. MCPF17_052 TaxID=2175655 RepID=UPI000DAAA463|nr:hypothetical protein [Curtobacterium sp. MCPF17_052]WIB11398.1 hypothetical protein DEJ36_10195 [Curtobacterium sp. MCPF17_052]